MVLPFSLWLKQAVVTTLSNGEKTNVAANKSTKDGNCRGARKNNSVNNAPPSSKYPRTPEEQTMALREGYIKVCLMRLRI